MELIRHTGWFGYPATVKLERGRRYQRQNFLAEMEYEIASVTSSEVQHDAVVAVPGARSKETVSFTGWDGKLWLPLTNPPEDTPFQISEYLGDLGQYYWRDIPPEEDVHDPLYHQHDPRMSSLSGIQLSVETEFAGTVEWSGKEDAITRHRAACERLLVIDGMVHYRTDGPVWFVSNFRRVVPPVPLVIEKPHRLAKRFVGDTFRADRLEDALEFGHRIFRKSALTARGQILQMDRSYMTRNDLAHGLDRRLSPIALPWGRDSHSSRAATFLSAQGLRSWRRLTLALDPQRPFFSYGVSDPIAVLADADVVLADMDRKSRPMADFGTIDETRRFFERIKAFAAWARSRGWEEFDAPRLDDGDEAGLTAFSGR